MSRSRVFSELRRLFAIAAWSARHGASIESARDEWSAHHLSRREVLRRAAATSFGVAAIPALSGCADEGGVEQEPVCPGSGARVAVIGAGIAGLHATWRLKQAGVDVTLYEAQERVGGRMWTARGEVPDGLLLELGGELIDSNHATMIALAEELGITLDDRWANEPAGLVRDTWFVGGARVSSETLLEQTRTIAAELAAQLEAAETDDDAFATWNRTSLQDWLDTYVPLDTLPELHEVLRVAYVGEFGLEAEEQSALNLHYLFGIDAEDEFLVFGDSDERWHAHEGNDTFATRLAERIGPSAIVTGAALVRASGPECGPYQLEFDGAPSTEVDHVVFALPFSTLRRVDLSGLLLSDTKREIIAELGYGTNAKVMGHFRSRPWLTAHNESGSLTTDLGVQQGWDTTIGQEPDNGAGVWTNFLGGRQGVSSGDGTARTWFELVLADLRTIWPEAHAAWSGQAVRMHWPNFAWSRGSYTCYRPGQWDYWSLEGVREGNVHFCGEHASLDFQGWMEGAAETGGLVAAAIIGEVAPDSAMAKALRPWASRPRPSRWTRRSRRLASR